MNRKRILSSILVLALGTTALPLAAHAQGFQRDRDQQQGDQLNQVLNDLKDAIQNAERRRSPDGQLIGDLRRIVQRYDSPWRVTLLQDDFRDGDMRRNPPWDVVAGDFTVDRQFGMRTRQNYRRPQQGGQGGGDLGNRLLGAVINEALRQPGQSGPPDRAEAYVRQPITTAYSVTLMVNSRSRDGGRVEFVLYQGRDQRDGYHLSYSPDSSPNMELLRVNGGRAQLVDSSRSRVDFEDGRDHRIVWSRNRDGDFQVEVDGRPVMQGTERGNDDFDGFGVVNLGGDFGLRSVQIAGTDRR